MRTRIWKCWLWLLLPSVLTGCVTARVTNLTPSQLPRDPGGFYPVEAAWRSNQQSLIKESIRAYAVVGDDVYPMQPVPLVADRWETLVHVPADQQMITYRFRFTYAYRDIPAVRTDSLLSPIYSLRIVDAESRGKEPRRQEP